MKNDYYFISNVILFYYSIFFLYVKNRFIMIFCAQKNCNAFLIAVFMLGRQLDIPSCLNFCTDVRIQPDSDHYLIFICCSSNLKSCLNETS